MSTKLPADVEPRTANSSSLPRLPVRRGFAQNNVRLIHLIHARLQLLNWPGSAQKKLAVPLTDYKKRKGGEGKKNLEKPNAVNPVGLERVNHGL